MKKAVLLIQKPLGERCFFEVIESHPNLVGAVVTNESVNNWWGTNRIFNYCKSNAIPVIGNEKRNEQELIEVIREHEIENLISVQHPWILSNAILVNLPGRAVNIHCAKLPEYKGYYSYNHAIINNDSKYYVTVHLMSGSVDSGDILYQPGFDITATDTAYSLFNKASDLAFDMFKMLISLDFKTDFSPYKQDGNGHFYGRNSLSAYREITTINPETIDRFARALYFPGFEGAYCCWNGNKTFLTPQLNMKEDQ